MARGHVLSLDLTWELAKAWYHDYLRPDWRRKTPEEASELFARLGLTGAFWQV